MATARKTRSQNDRKNTRSGGMVDLDAGTISREVFVNPEIYAHAHHVDRGDARLRLALRLVTRRGVWDGITS